MTENLLPNEFPMTEKKAAKLPRWLIVLIPTFLIGICCLIFAFVLPSIFNVNFEHGNYGVGQVILSSDLKDNQPVNVKDIFKPSDNIICTVQTTGVDGGIIGMRWFFGDKLIYETTSKAQNNKVYSAIGSNSSAILAEGKYHVDILIANDIIKTINFEIKIYHPSVKPPMPTPAGHSSIELPWFPEVPFAFDETWKIGGDEWKVNEVKVVLREDVKEYFVAVLINTESDPLSLSDNAAKEMTRPIALYALENGYVEEAKSLEIDGKHYDLDQSFFVILINPSSHHINRVEFKMDELKNPSG